MYIFYSTAVVDMKMTGRIPGRTTLVFGIMKQTEIRFVGSYATSWQHQLSKSLADY